MPPSFRSRFKSFSRIFWWLSFFVSLFLSFYVGEVGRIPTAVGAVTMLLLYPWLKASPREPLMLPIAALVAHATWFAWASYTENNWSNTLGPIIAYCVEVLVLLFFPRRWPILVVGLLCLADFGVGFLNVLVPFSSSRQVKMIDTWLDFFAAFPLLLEFVRLEADRAKQRKSVPPDESEGQTDDENAADPATPRRPARNLLRRSARPGQDPRSRL